MEREQIIRMAREAGCIEPAIPDWVIRTCALVVSAEREACAKIVEESSLPDAYSEPVLLDIADDIRARGQE